MRKNNTTELRTSCIFWVSFAQYDYILLLWALIIIKSIDTIANENHENDKNDTFIVAALQLGCINAFGMQQHT